MNGWETTVRTGDPGHDRATIEAYRAQAAAQGLALQELPLPEGGFHVRAVPVAAAQAAAPYAPANAYAPPNPYAAPHAPVGQPAPAVFGAGRCQVCGASAETKHVTLLQNVGLIAVRFHRQLSGQMCKACIRENFWRYTTITFLFGWWGVISFFFTLFILPANCIAMWSARNLPEVPGRPPSKVPGVVMTIVGSLFALVFVALLVAAISDAVGGASDPIVGFVGAGFFGAPAFVLLFFGVRGLRVRAA